MDAQAPNTPSTDMSLLERVQQRDNVAWEKFVEIYAPVVLYWCKRQGLRATDRDDVFQDVSRALLTGLRNFRKDTEQQQFRRYLWTVTRSKIQDLRRRRPRRLRPPPARARRRRAIRPCRLRNRPAAANPEASGRADHGSQAHADS